jgi:HD-GYP domain-containing protein (c-di-GMP phosphodiesterase class II)
VTAIADVFDALTTRRSYKNALQSFPSLKIMKEDTLVLNSRAED